MLRINYSVFLAVSLLLFAVVNTDAYFFSATDGDELFLFVARSGSNGKLVITSDFKYAAPGTIGATALLPSKKSTATKKVFDLFGTFVKDGKPVVFRDRLEFDETSQTWRFVSRKFFPTHKVDSYNTFSGSATTSERSLLTENGTDVNRRNVSGTGNLSGANKKTFNNSSQVDPLAAALSPDGAFAVQSTFTNSASAQGGADALGFYGLDVVRTSDGVKFTARLGGYAANVVLAEETANAVCLVFKEIVLNIGASPTGQDASASDKSGVFYVNFDPITLQPRGNFTTISKLSSTPLSQYEIFNTTIFLPDGRGIVYGKHKKGKLEWKVQELNGPCGPKIGAPYPLLSAINPIIASNNPIYGWAAAPCAAIPGLCD